MQEYLNMWRNYLNFSDRTSRRGFWMASLCNLVVAGILALMAAMMPFLFFFLMFYSLAVIVPEFSISVRRLRDVGKKWYYVFLPFIPVIGSAVLIITLCRRSVEDDGTPVV